MAKDLAAVMSVLCFAPDVTRFSSTEFGTQYNVRTSMRQCDAALEAPSRLCSDHSSVRVFGAIEE